MGCLQRHHPSSAEHLFAAPAAESGRRLGGFGLRGQWRKRNSVQWIQRWLGQGLRDAGPRGDTDPFHPSFRRFHDGRVRTPTLTWLALLFLIVAAGSVLAPVQGSFAAQGLRSAALVLVQVGYLTGRSGSASGSAVHVVWIGAIVASTIAAGVAMGLPPAATAGGALVAGTAAAAAGSRT